MYSGWLPLHEFVWRNDFPSIKYLAKRTDFVKLNLARQHALQHPHGRYTIRDSRSLVMTAAQCTTSEVMEWLLSKFEPIRATVDDVCLGIHAAELAILHNKLDILDVLARYSSIAAATKANLAQFGIEEMQRRIFDRIRNPPASPESSDDPQLCSGITETKYMAQHVWACRTCSDEEDALMCWRCLAAGCHTPSRVAEIPLKRHKIVYRGILLCLCACAEESSRAKHCKCSKRVC